MVRRLGVLLCLFLSTFPARSEPGPSAADDLAACRRLVQVRSFRQAADAYRKLFADWPEDPAILAALPDIEDDLRRAHYRLAVPEPTARDLYGPAAKSFNPATLKLELQWPTTPGGEPWTEPAGSLWVLLIRFRDRVTVSFEFPAGATGVLLCYSIEKSGGYVVRPNHVVTKGRLKASVLAIQRLDDGEATLLATETPYAPSPADPPVYPKRFEVRRDSNAVTAWGDRKGLAKVIDARYRGGYVGFIGARPTDVRVEGVVEEKFHRQRAGEWDETRFRKWQAESWKPAEVIPAWARDRAPVTAAPPVPLLPSDGDTARGDLREIERLVERVLDGDEPAGERLAALAGRQPPLTSLYLISLVALAAGCAHEAEVGLTSLLSAEPGFARGRALRGFARLHLRRIPEARADFDEAIRLAPGLELAFHGRVQLALLEGDLDAAAATLDAATAAGLRTPSVVECRTMVQRARRGPLWTRPFEAATAHFVVRTDHSADLAREVARLLENALAVYARAFPAEKVPPRKSRVWLFASESGYLGYAGDVKVALAGSAGAYDPRLRELVLFLPADRSRFVHTVRHEGFHRFMHDFLDDQPLWFAEGCAEFFSSGRDLGDGQFAIGRAIPEYVEHLLGGAEALTPLCELFVLSPPEFMEKPRLHYAQGWAVVHYLQNTKDTALAPVFRDYWTALREGIGEEEAYERVLAPVAERIERALPAYLRSLRE
ncbi:MAG: DUF1570 domain-containing protein [Planctomycetes bacterium]|jgi:tetratricopeptide (TPR) repeat protein|nr:DUF1570 domain-containing protein [Planctomycetota bacterium]